MFCRNITSFICIFVAGVIATVHNDSHSMTGSDLEVTVYSLTTESPESSTRQPDQQVMESIAGDLSNLLDAGDGAFVTLVTGDTRLAAHKAVLTARSPVFAETLERMTLEANSGQLVIPDVEGPILRHLLAYMYTLQAPQVPDIAPQLLAAADMYGLPALKAHCEQQVAAQLSVETAVTAAVLAVRHSCSSLMQAAIAFINTHIFHVMATQSWADAMKRQPDDLMKVIRQLSDPPAEIRSQLAEEEKRGLLEAAKEGTEEEVEALLSAGADVDARDDWRLTALHWAARLGHVEVARRLLAAGAAVETRDHWQWTPLHLAAENGHTAVVRLLLEEASADPNARDVGGRTPLHWAAYWGQAEAAAALLQAGANRGATDNEGRTPLDLARNRNRHQLIDILTGS